MKKRAAALLVTACMAISAGSGLSAGAVEVSTSTEGSLGNGTIARGGLKSENQEIVRSILDGGSYAVPSSSYQNMIDVSFWQGDIDWTQVKAAGIDYAMLRVGYRDSDTGEIKHDTKFKTYIKDAQEAGIEVGVYFFSQAVTAEEAQEEAAFTLDQIKGYRLELPVTIDFEYHKNGRLTTANLPADEQTAICSAFCNEVQSAGYSACIYANNNMLTNHLDASQLSEKYLIWMADYSNQTDYSGEYTFWQYSETGSIAGISTNKVDCNFWFDDGRQYNTTANLTDAPGGISSFQAERTGVTTAQLSWDAVADVSGYEIYLSTSGDKGTYEKAKTTINPFRSEGTITGLSADQEYYFRVRAYSKSDGEYYYGSLSKAQKVTTYVGT